MYFIYPLNIIRNVILQMDVNSQNQFIHNMF